MSKAQKTKEKILGVALTLFNERGISKISSKTISQEVGISYGNLCYHFNKKEEIIAQLYLNMQTELNEQYQQLLKEIYGFDFMARSLRVLLNVLYKYKFVQLSLTHLMRISPPIKDHALEQMELRRTTLTNMFTFLIKEGYLYEEKVKGHYESLIHSLLMITNACIINAEFFYTGQEKDKVNYYLEIIYSMVRSSLTKKGLKAFNEVYLIN